jgi:excisionase family DNA binding protein
MPSKLLTADDIAERLSISKRQAFALMQEGILPSIRIGRNVRCDESDLEEFINRNKTNKLTESERNITKL